MVCYLQYYMEFLDLPVERLNEVNQEIVRGCSLSLFEFDGKNIK